MEQPSPKKSQQIRDIIAQDINPSPALVQSKLGLAVFAGAIMDLAICGQFGIGLTPWAHVLGHSMHTQMSPLACAWVCGAIFALFPSVLLRFVLCTRMQFQILLRRQAAWLLVWYAGVVAMLAFFGDHEKGFWELSSWLLSALIVTQVFGLLIGPRLAAWQAAFRGKRI